MQTNPTPEEVRASIVANSEQLNADELLTGPITVTIEKVSKGNREQPIHIGLAGYKDKSFRPCKTVRRILITLWTDDATKWIGQRLTIFTDPDVVYGGVRVGGLRVSHATGIDKPKTFMLTKTRGKKSEITIHPITGLAAEQRKFVAEATKKFESAETPELLEGYGATLKEQPEAVRAALKPIYAKRKQELTDADH